MPAKSIADSLGISEPTVAARLRALESSGSLRVVLKRCTLQDHPAGALFRIEIFVDDPMSLDAVAAGLATATGILSAYKTSGRPEIIATCEVPHIRDAASYLDGLAKALPGASRISSAMILDVRHQRPCLHNLSMPDRVALGDPDLLRAELRRDARQPASVIARKLGIPEATARQKIRRLVEAPGNRIVAMRDAKAAGYAVWADLQLTVAPSQVAATFARLERTEDIVMATRLTGDSNLGIFIAAAEVEALDRFVTRDIRTLPGLVTFRILRVTDIVTTDYSVDFAL